MDKTPKKFQNAPDDFSRAKVFVSKSGKYFSIKVRLIHERFSIAIMIAMNIYKSAFDEKFSIKVCLKNFNQGLVAKS